MILPVYAYGHPVLRAECADIDNNFPDLDSLIDNMFETMYHAKGVGLAAPQIGKNIRLFIVDATPMAEDYKDGQTEQEKAEYEFLSDFKRVFINPIIIDEYGEKWGFEEGCLSIPDIRGEVERQPEILLEYYDRDWNLREERFKGFAARVIQHEYDHIEGILFTDLLHPIRRRLVSRKLQNIKSGNIQTKYPMKFVR
jgi:peptide deformylase